MVKALYEIRIFPDDETTEIVYSDATHCFWEANNTILTVCLPTHHDHWPRERFRHYTVKKLDSDEPVKKACGFHVGDPDPEDAPKESLCTCPDCGAFLPHGDHKPDCPNGDL